MTPEISWTLFLVVVFSVIGILLYALGDSVGHQRGFREGFNLRIKFYEESKDSDVPAKGKVTQ